MVLERETRMEDSKQGKILNIAYSGVEGAFANIAAKNIFPDMNMVACSDFSEAYEKRIKAERNKLLEEWRNKNL